LRNLINGIYSKIAFRYDKGAWLTNRHVKSWFRSVHDVNKPFFMFVHYMEPHLKYSPPKKYRNLFHTGDNKKIKKVNQNPFDYMIGKTGVTDGDFDFLERLYDAELAYLDTCFAEFINLLEEQDVLKNSIIILTSDHGENIGEHGLMDHQYCLYETLLHVPLLIYMPGFTPAPQVVNQSVEIKDIFPTILDFLNMEADLENLKFPGYSLLPNNLEHIESTHCLAEYLQPQPSIDELRSRYPGFDPSQYDRSLRSIIDADGYKLIWSSDGKHELYDLNLDPSENNNIVGINPTKAKELDRLLASYLPPLDENLGERVPSQLAIEDPSIRKRLQDLGYL
jgi:arylsulfatase A-like enzyme